MRPQRSEGTALVMDIAGFTTFSSQHPPEHVIGVLDSFLADATDVVSGCGGIVMAYLGDGFLDTFNAPIRMDQPAQAAADTARDLLDVAEKHGSIVRIGIASGELVTGTIGSAERQSFAVYGTTVNLASQLESECKKLELSILADAATRQSGDWRDQFSAIGARSIPGIEEPLAIHSLGSVSR